MTTLEPAAGLANDSPLTPLRFLQRSAEVYPNKDAILYGSRRYSYTEFKAAAERMARGIRARIAPGDRVVFLAPNVPEMLIAHFAVPLAGGILVALNSRLARPEIEYVLKHSEASLLFVDAELAATVGDARPSSKFLRGVIEMADAEFGLAASGLDFGQQTLESFLADGDAAALTDARPLRWDVDDERAPLTINYTSGTTGKPKGVVYSHRGAYLNSFGEVFHNSFTSASVYLWTLPMFHCNGWCTPWAVTAAGATHVCLRAVRADSVWGAIDTLGITNLCGAPTVCSLIANAPQAHELDRPLSITTAGAPPAPSVIEQLERLRVNVVHVYGLTEVYGPYTICEYQPEWDDLPADERARRISRQGVGMLQAESARVVDEFMVDVPKDGVTIGEIVLRGNNVMLGYYRDPQATAEAFRGGWFHTGDLGVMHPDGYLELRDRAKDIIISGGENISSIEVENAMLSHPTVLDVAVVGIPHEKWGERPKAYVVLRPDHAATAVDLLTHTRYLIASFKVPDDVQFVETLPRTATGKVMKMMLRDLHLELEQ
ncbi:acyl-CoA synthetase [Cryobacterium sp. TMT1-21]|uniref:Acyl-CoA synthetase n=3 Tax=Microbacteriaceae TaxID=85023 RepID=A0AAQ2HFX5_9MICO|nr:acyl-CoA synthetase [Cryobacterium shii]TFC88210.1 acyl-CoA synthetase [Cryobacterium sp. TmT2-59]TFD13844.1 acyl-CoA synthetase [Cryobacterium sp. TMT1-21]TFD38006.1 acyl-CoA synthetase [Cryobacterium sp. TMT2-10]